MSEWKDTLRTSFFGEAATILQPSGDEQRNMTETGSSVCVCVHVLVCKCARTREIINAHACVSAVMNMRRKSYKKGSTLLGLPDHVYILVRVMECGVVCVAAVGGRRRGAGAPQWAATAPAHPAKCWACGEPPRCAAGVLGSRRRHVGAGAPPAAPQPHNNSVMAARLTLAGGRAGAGTHPRPLTPPDPATRA